MIPTWAFSSPDIALGQIQFSAASDSISACFQRGSNTQAVRQWDRQTGRLIREISWSLGSNRSTVNVLRPAVISGSHLWRFEDGFLICQSMRSVDITVSLPYPDLHDVAAATDGTLVILCEKSIQWLNSDGAVAARFNVECRYGASVAHATADSVFVLEPRRILRIERDGYTCWEVYGIVDHVAISPEKVFVISEEPGLISSYCARSGQLLRQARRKPFSVTSVATFGDHPIFAITVSCEGGSSLEILHAETLTKVWSLQLEPVIHSMTYLESTRQLAILARRRVQLYDLDERIMLTLRC